MREGRPGRGALRRFRATRRAPSAAPARISGVPRLDVRSHLAGSHGYGILLGLVAASAIYTVAAPDTQGWQLGIVVFQTAIVGAAVWSTQPGRPVELLLGALVAAVLIAAIVTTLGSGDSKRDLSVLAAILATLVPFVVVTGLIRTLREEGASQRAIAGALSVYLLIGMLCAYVYRVIATVGSGPLFANGQGDGDASDQVYFSFVTQTTVGYGDFVPDEPVARAVAIAQALTGQLYLVTVVSLLVGGYVSAARSRRDAG